MTTQEMATPLVDHQPSQTASHYAAREPHVLQNLEIFYRKAGYIPFISSMTGPIRSGIGVIGFVVNAVCVPIFALFRKHEYAEQSKQYLIVSARWIIRGIVESKPFVGNALCWSWDTFNERLEGKKYLSDMLYENRFVPIVSMVTGALRAIRGAAGATVGATAEVVFRAMKKLHLRAGTDEKIHAAHKFTKESLYEVPQGIIEAIPLCDGISPPLARIAEGFEQTKIALWKDQPHQE